MPDIYQKGTVGRGTFFLGPDGIMLHQKFFSVGLINNMIDPLHQFEVANFL
jgi:hypothetical protein